MVAEQQRQRLIGAGRVQRHGECQSQLNPGADLQQRDHQSRNGSLDVGGNQVGFSYYPNSTVSPATNMIFTADASGSYSNSYLSAPAFYISYFGQAKDGGGSVYKIDAVGYGGNALSVAVVESMYEIGSGVTNLGGL